MSQAFSAILSPAVGVLISPLPVVGLILILLSNKARSNSIFYMLGWIVGNAAVFTIGMLCMGAGVQQGEPGTVKTIVSVVLGILLIVVAIREFMKRPKKGQEAPTPKWFAKLTQIGVWGAAGFGFFLSALNFKNMLLSLSAGTGVGALGLSGGQEAASTVIYTFIASASIIVPTVAFLIAGKQMDKILDSLRGWLVQYNAIIMSVLLLMIGINMIAKVL